MATPEPSTEPTAAIASEQLLGGGNGAASEGANRLHSGKTDEPRFDFIRRFVAVAVSVGFATLLVNMKFVKEGVLPTSFEQQTIARLLTGFVIFLFGWLWFHRDLETKIRQKANSISILRFFLDALIVVASLIFLVSSYHQLSWLIALEVIFFLYVVWDILLIFETRATDAWRGTAITSIATLYYLGMLLVCAWLGAPSTFGVYVTCIFALGYSIGFGSTVILPTRGGASGKSA